MAGILVGSVESYHDGTLAVQPQDCAVEDAHRLHRPVCYRTYPDGEFRACPYWGATTRVGNFCDRAHPTTLHRDAVALGARSTRCNIVCMAAKRNRPAGC